MKPIQLTIQAFGSYGTRTVIDFTKPDQNLFLITGNTGSGKSTIFDAIAFALYGRASSALNKKEGVELQSQYVECGVRPFVELTFSEQEGGETKIYTVHRVPRHVRPLKKGTGTKEESESVSLILPDGSEYSQNRKETNTRLEEIVGLTFSQFLQVAMIAQGEFMELLRADSNQKKEIFQKLFHTELYQSIVKELDLRKKSRQTAMAEIRTACRTEISHLEIPEDAADAQELEELQNRVCNGEKFSVVDLEELQQRLETLCGTLCQQEQAQSEQVAKASALRDRKHTALSSAKLLAGAYEQLDRAEETLSRCEADQPMVEALERSVAQIRAAYELMGVCERMEDAEKTVRRTENQQREQEEALPGLSEQEASAAEKERTAETEKTEALEAYSAVADRVRQARTVFEKLRAAEQTAASAETALEAARQDAQQAQLARTALEDEIARKQSRRQALEGTELALSRWEQKAREADELRQEADGLQLRQQEILRQKDRAKRSAVAYAAARDRFREKNEAYQATRTAFLDAQAGFLAREKLRPGKPCPVCGSLEHPHPCVLAQEHRELTRETLEVLEREQEQCNREQNDAAAAAGSAADVLKEKQEQFDAEAKKLLEQLRKSIEPERENLSGMRRSIDAWRAELAQQEPALRGEADELLTVRDFLSHAEEQRKRLSAESERAEDRCREAETALAAAGAAVTELRLQRSFASETLADEALREAKIRKNAAVSAFDAAYQELLSARSAREKAETLLGQFRQALPVQREELELRKMAYDKALAASGMTESVWQAVTEQHEKGEIETLQRRLQEQQTLRANAEGIRAAALETVGDRPRPVLDELEQAFHQAEEALREVQQIQETRRHQVRANRRVLDALAPRMEQRSRITREYACIERLHNRLAGKESGSRMDIETYVQRCYLQRILRSANLRFREMSAGQFELRLIPEEQAGEGKNRGLDLMVYSTVTGQEREVRTLSGGESFLAALSLALGMADQIQEKSAAIHLDMMFIDEGFGSLDSHSREQAVRVLQRMAGGNRLIGIISHVTELKSAIEDQLLVTKDETGSHVRWVIS